MATLTRLTIAPAGTSAAMSAADVAGDKVLYAAGAKVLVYNGDGSSVTVTMISEVADTLGRTAADNVVTVGAGELAVIPLADVYKASADNLCAWTYSAVTSLEVAVI